MAETGFWLKGAKGKLAGTVMYTTGGRTIQRQIVSPKNPQSDNQMRQRVVFAGASKFFQNAQQNRFTLAFQNKKGNQSEFNAFMQKNLREFDTLPFPTREQANTPEFCNYFPWICTEGNLQGIPVAFADDDSTGLGADIQIAKYDQSEGVYVLAASWEELIALNPTLGLQYGDIITVTVVINDEKFNDNTLNVEIGTITPRWITRQIVIGTDLAGYSLIDYLSLNGFIHYSSMSNKESLFIDLDDVCEELGINDGSYFGGMVAAMICVTRSRREGSKLKVSPSRFYLTDMAQRIYTRLSNDTQMRDAIDSYKTSANSNSTPANILQGSVVEGFRTSLALVQKRVGDHWEGIETPLPASDVTGDISVVSNEKECQIILKSYDTKWQQSELADITVEAAGTGVYVLKYIVEGESTDLVIKIKGPTSLSGNKAFSVAYKGVTILWGNINFTNPT